MRSGLPLLHLAPILLTVALLLGAASGSGKRVPSGSWGGRGVGMNVTEEGASIEFDCAHASLQGAIALEADGSLDARGTYFQERPGPQKVEEEEKGRAARFTGRLDGSEIQLTVTFADDQQEEVGSYSLVLNRAPRLRKCR